MTVSHAGTETMNKKSSKAKPKRLPGVGSSRIVRRRMIRAEKQAMQQALARMAALPSAAFIKQFRVLP